MSQSFWFFKLLKISRHLTQILLYILKRTPFHIKLIASFKNLLRIRGFFRSKNTGNEVKNVWPILTINYKKVTAFKESFWTADTSILNLWADQTVIFLHFLLWNFGQKFPSCWWSRVPFGKKSTNLVRELKAYMY